MSSRNKRNVIVKQGLDGWVMTYGDMMSLLLTFFVLIVSFSSMQETKFKEAALSLRKAFGVLVQPQSVINFNDPLVPKSDFSQRDDILFEIRELEMALLEAGVQQQVQVDFTPEGVVFRVNAPVLFAPGRAQLQPGSEAVLGRLTEFFRKFPNEVRVEGHSDAVPIATARFPSNWDLSAARAVSVARYFQEQGVPPERLVACGYGEHRPLAPNDTEAGRARNRRVEIFLKVDRNRPGPVGKPLSRAIQPATGAGGAFLPVTESLGTLQPER